MAKKTKSPRMTPEQAKSWRERWRAVEEFELEELRRTPAIVKLRQLNTLMEWGRRLGWDRQLEAEKVAVRQRFSRLRRMYLEQKAPPGTASGAAS